MKITTTTLPEPQWTAWFWRPDVRYRLPRRLHVAVGRKQFNFSVRGWEF